MADNVRPIRPAPSPPTDLLAPDMEDLRDVFDLGGLVLDDQERTCWAEEAAALARVRPLSDDDGYQLTLMRAVGRIQSAAAVALAYARRDDPLREQMTEICELAKHLRIERGAALGIPVYAELAATRGHQPRASRSSVSAASSSHANSSSVRT